MNRQELEDLQEKVRMIVYLGFGPALEDEVERMLAEARATARRRGDQAVMDHLAAIHESLLPEAEKAALLVDVRNAHRGGK